MDKEKLIEEGKKDLKQKIKNLLKTNEDGTYTLKMPGEIEDYTIKDLTNREEHKAKELASKDIPEDNMLLIRMVKHPIIKTTEWGDMPAKVKKRLELAKNYLDGDLDFLE